MNSLPLNSPPSPHSTNTNQEPTVNNQITTNKKENIRVNDWSTHAQLDKLIKTISSNSPSSIRDEFESLLIIYPTSVQSHHFINKLLVIFSLFCGFHIVVGSFLKLK